MNIAYWNLTNGTTPRMMLGALLAASPDPGTIQSDLRALLGSDGNLHVDEGAEEDGQAWHARVEIPKSSAKKTIEELEVGVEPARLPDAAEKRARAILHMAKGVTQGAERGHLATDEWAETLCVLLGYESLTIDRSYRSHFFFGPNADPDAVRLVHNHTVQPHAARSLPFSLLGAALMLALAPTTGDPPVTLLTRLGIGNDALPTSSKGGGLQLLLGRSSSVTHEERVYQVETTIDDMNPELYPAVLASLRKHGALDTWWTGAVTKSGRPGATISALVPHEMLSPVVTAMLEETTSIGVRFHEVARRVLPRREYKVETSLGTVGVKESTLPSGNLIWKTELKDCQRIAEQSGTPVKEVRATVNREIRKQRNTS